MKKIEISIISHGLTEKALIECDRKSPTLIFTMNNGFSKTYKAEDLYVCLGLLRADSPEIKFLCKGAKLNVHPSGMSSQMSGGVMAYEHQLGRPADREDVVNIFDYEEVDITNDIQRQMEFYKRWLGSLAE